MGGMGWIKVHFATVAIYLTGAFFAFGSNLLI